MVGRSYNQMVCLATLLLACVGCQESLSPQAKQWLQSGYTASAAGQHQAVITNADAFLSEYGRSKRADEAYYLRGLAKYHLGDPSGAREDLKAALARTNKPELQGKAALALGDLAWEADDMTTAVDMYQMALDHMDRSVRPADHAAYRLGCVLQRLGRWREADLPFSRVMELFPDSELANRSSRRVHGRAWAIQLAAFADRGGAQDKVNALAGQGVQTSVLPAMGDSKPTFVVQTGRYPTWEQATAALPSIKRLQPDAFVTATR